MLKKIQVTALSAVFLLYAFGMLQAHSLYILPDVNDSEPTKPLVKFSSANESQTKNHPNSLHRQPASHDIDPAHKKQLKPVPQTAKPKRPSSSISQKLNKKKIPAWSSSQKFVRTSRPVRLREKLVSDYRKRTGKRLIIISGPRRPAQQARAIRRNVRTFGVRYVMATYGYGPAIREIIAAYKENRRIPRKAQQEMTSVIESQVARGIYISNHLRGLAVDVRSRGRGAARLSILRQVARSLGGSVSIERDHFHVNLT